MKNKLICKTASCKLCEEYSRNVEYILGLEGQEKTRIREAERGSAR